MIKNYLLIAIRSLWRQKSFTAVNVSGLAVAMAISLLTLLYITNQVTFDRFHEKKSRIYRLILKTESPNEGTRTSCEMTAGIGPSFLEEIPQVESIVRFSTPEKGFLTVFAQNFEIPSYMYADSSVFRIFTFPLVYGNPLTALTAPYSLVLTRSMAEKIFQNADKALGKTVRLNNRDDLQVTGIMEDPPVNSHLRFSALISFTSLYQNPKLYLDWNGGMSYFTYLLLHENAAPRQVENQMIPIADENINNNLRDIGVVWSFFLQPLTKVHLSTNVDYEIESHTSVTSLWVYIAITLVLLMVACINFINLTLAASLRRIKEIGIRKVIGARKGQVITQFLTETMIIGIIAVIHALILVELLHWWLASSGIQLEILNGITLYNNSFFRVGGIILFLVLIVGLIAGIYPAFYLAGIMPAMTVKGIISKKGNPVIRNLLVVFQFAISIVLIICTLVITSQLNYLLKKDKGFDPTGKLVIAMESEKARENYINLEESFKSVPGIAMVGASSQIPGLGFTQNGYFPEGLKEPMMIHVLDVDYGYLETMGLEIVQGRNFSKESGTDGEAYIINQALARQLGWMHPIGKTIRRSGKHKVIGVVRDFHYSPLHNKIEPLIITMKPWQGYSYLTLAVTGEVNEDLNSRLESAWKKVIPYEDFQVFSLEALVKEAYQSEQMTRNILIFCSALALFIASLGLLALAAFSTRQRYKEIAVRKVFGAAIGNIFYLVSSGFVKWVVLANIIAWPIAWMIMDKYLQNFAYAIGVKWWVFLLALLFTVALSLVVVLVQVIRLGRLNPVNYIRYE